MLRVLLIDDEEIEYKLIKLMFRDVYEGDYHLEYASTLQDAELLLERKDFDMILLDDNLADGTNAKTNVPVLKTISENTALCIVSKNIDADHLRDKTILDVYDVIDKFDLRARLKRGLAA